MDVEENEKMAFDLKLTKLPLFGQQLAPNFEFPKKRNLKPPIYTLENLQRNIKLCEIAFKRRAVGNEL